MNFIRPIKNYFAHLFAKKQLVNEHTNLEGLIGADAIFYDLVNQKKVPGLSVTVLNKGKAVLQKGYGYANLDTEKAIIPKTSLFRIASVSKPIASVALAHAVADGFIDLDTSFYNYVPYYPKKEWDFTIRQLAGHTAGVRGYQGAEYGLNKPYSIKESIVVFKDDALLYEPGSAYFYTSYDWVLISLAIEEATSINFEEYVQQKVLKPLELENTFADKGDNLKSTIKEHLTKFYTRNKITGFREAIPVNNYFKLAGGGFLSTSADVANFGQAILERNSKLEVAIHPFITQQKINNTPTYYGLGWQVSQDAKGRQYYGHIGNGVGGYANFFVYPNEQLVFAILTNCTDPKIQDELDEAIDKIVSSTNLTS